MCANTNKQKSEECLWLLLRLSACSIETGSHFSATLEACKPQLSSCLHPNRSWGAVLVGCPVCYVCAGVHMLVFRTVEQALITAEPLTPKCQLLRRPTPLSDQEFCPRPGSCGSDWRTSTLIWFCRFLCWECCRHLRNVTFQLPSAWLTVLPIWPLG